MQHRKLGRYELLRVLGKGAMGVVYEGRDPNLDRHVAIKTIMVDDLGPDAAVEYEARFRTEARSAARLHHANIVTVHDSDRDGDTAFLVMEYIQGEDLKHHLDNGVVFSPQEALHLVCDLLAALDFAHRQGVVHRDVKPANLLLEPGGRLKLTDFGVARITGDATRTQGTMVGTLKYMAPEQVQGLRVDSRADIFSAGVVAYQLFTGVRPFDGDNDFSIIHQIIGHTPPAPSTVRPELPKALDAVLGRGMAKDREQRFQTGAEFSDALQQAFGMSFSPVAPSLPPRAGTVATAIQSAPTMPGSGIGQELELEYWRAVRDSTEPEELQGFLARFPQGIYADLARRRLNRLGDAAPDPDRTVLQGMTRPPAKAPAEAGLDPTLALLARPSAPPLQAPEASQPETTSTATMPAAPAVAPAGPPAPVGATGAGKPMLWAALAAVAAVAIAAAVLLAGRRPEPASAVTAASPAPAAVPASGPAESASAAASHPVAAAVAATGASASVAPAAPTASQAASVASAHRRAAPTPAQRRREAAAPAATPAPAAASVAPTPVQPEARPAPPPAPVPVAPSTPAPAAVAQRLPSPQETCKDLIIVARELCYFAECRKPGVDKQPFCVKLRAEAKAREEAAEKERMSR